MIQSNGYSFIQALNNLPDAYAVISGSSKYPLVSGFISFYQVPGGVVVLTEVNGLPVEKGICKEKVFGYHIHEGNACTGTAEMPFQNAKGHYNPQGCQHPDHAGDLPPLFGNAGYAWYMFFTDRFAVSEIMGRTVIIHGNPDDFVTQPSGNAGEMIACGVIR